MIGPVRQVVYMLGSRRLLYPASLWLSIEVDRNCTRFELCGIGEGRRRECAKW